MEIGAPSSSKYQFLELEREMNNLLEMLLDLRGQGCNSNERAILRQISLKKKLLPYLQKNIIIETILIKLV